MNRRSSHSCCLVGSAPNFSVGGATAWDRIMPAIGAAARIAAALPTAARREILILSTSARERIAKTRCSCFAYYTRTRTESGGTLRRFVRQSCVFHQRPAREEKVHSGPNVE